MNPREKALQLAKKVAPKEGWTKKNLPKAKRFEGGGAGFSYKDVKKFTKVPESTGHSYKAKLPKAAHKAGAFYNPDTRKWES